ncbi:MAG: hypothetical protein LUQ18_10735 [Methylococcaceae bacterium]|nr:hypothetical protein [Methylococcaceae bacterium]
MDNNEKMHILCDITEQQQAAILDAITEFKKQNERLESAGGNLQKVVKNAIVESMSGTAGTAKKAVDDALSPALQSINGTINAANSANERLNRTVSRLGWQMALMAAGVVVAVMACTQLAVWWQRSELEDIKANIASQDPLKRQIKVQNCDGRPCVEVDTSVPTYGGSANIYVLKGVRFK